MATLVLSLFFCEGLFAQHEPDTLGTQGNTGADEFRKLERELLEYVERGVEANLISTQLRDSILQYVRETKRVMEGRFVRFAAAANHLRGDSLPPHRVIVMRDGVPIVVDTLHRMETLEYAGTPFRKNGVDKTILYPDKLPVPERDKANKNKYQYLSQEEMKRNILRADYFSKGMDGYYQKQIALGQVGQGWEETREMRELVNSIRASLQQNLYPEGAVSQPEFLSKMNGSKNSFVRFLGGLLGIFQNGAMQQMNPGFKSNNPLAPIPVPARR